MSSLFDRIAALHGERPWGAVLDAGTGRSSMRWLLGLETERWTAVTGASSMARQTRLEVGERMREDDRIVIGNWSDPEFLAGQRYDTVLADYLLGAIEGFSPYWQDRLFERLRPMVDGRLYVIGLEPYVHRWPADVDGQLVSMIGRVRDACLLLAGAQPYREYPMDWTLRHLESARFRIISAEKIAIRYGERFVNGQLDMCVRNADRFQDGKMAAAMLEHVEQLRQRALAHVCQYGGIRHGHDYIVVAEPV